jgi:Glycosyltransferases, probably involved in cell wall biogenesis
MLSLSLIIPVYNRPQEVDELLASLTKQSDRNFEVIIVEDGSTDKSEDVVNSYSEALSVSYHFIPNGGPGQARNYGARTAQGEYLIVLDSDCVVPEDYIRSVRAELTSSKADAFGGPDKAFKDFSSIQKAINYSMTSFFTTGGIRGGKKKMDKFYPRSFNMGVRKKIYDELGGFSKMRFGEDIDFSIRIYRKGYKICLFSSAWVYHKRRTDWKKFYRQVYNSGIARINLFRKYPDSLKVVHLLPSIFTVGALVCFILGFLSPLLWLPLGLFTLIVFCDSTTQNKSFKIGLLSIIASFIQLFGYGLGFLSAFWKRIVLKKNEFSAFNENFYS